MAMELMLTNPVNGCQSLLHASISIDKCTIKLSRSLAKASCHWVEEVCFDYKVDMEDEWPVLDCTMNG